MCAVDFVLANLVILLWIGTFPEFGRFKKSKLYKKTTSIVKFRLIFLSKLVINVRLAKTIKVNKGKNIFFLINSYFCNFGTRFISSRKYYCLIFKSYVVMLIITFMWEYDPAW